MKSSSKGILFVIAILGLLSAGSGSCESVKSPKKDASPSTKKERTSSAEESSAQTGQTHEGELDAKARQFVMVYQSLMGGDTEPCG